MDTKSTVQGILDNLIAKHDRMVSRQIDAGACRTRYDYQRAERAEQEYQEAYDKAVDELGSLIGW